MKLDRDLFERLRAGTELLEAHSVNDAILALIEPLLEERRKIVDAKEAAREVVKAADAELSRVDRMLRAAGHELEKPPAPSRNGRGSTSRDFERKVEMVRPLVISEGGEWTTGRLRKQLPELSSSSRANILERLRRDGVLRMVGTQPGRGGEHRVYRLHADADARVEEEQS